MKTVETRRFLGNTENFENPREQKFNKRMLDAYLKGNEYFNYLGNTYKVKQEYDYRN